MKHIIIAIAVTALCALLKWIAERWWHNAQRFILPVLIGGALYLDLHHPLVSVTPLLSIAVIVLGYSVYGSSDFWDRFFWLMDGEALIWIGCLVLNHLSWEAYIPAVIVCGLWGAFTRKGNNNWVAPLSGLLWGIVYFFVH